MIMFGFPHVVVYLVFLQPTTTRDASSSSRVVIARDADRKGDLNQYYI